MEKKQERKKEKGITLVALVVTIIVLIILAGVTLNIVLDQDGIINKAQQAVGDYDNAQKEEQEMLNQVENYMNMFQKIAEADLNQLSDEEYYQLLTQIYSITLDKKDYLEIFSELYKKEYTNFYLIATKMTLEDTETTGYHHSFDWWKQLYQVYYIIAATSKMAENKNFSKNEMKKMLQNNEIVILCEKTKPVEESDLDFKQESYEKLPSLNFELLEKKIQTTKKYLIFYLYVVV